MSAEYLTLREVSDLTGVPVNTLRRWRRTGHPPVSFNLGARVRYRRQDVEEWLDKQYRETRTA